MPRMAAAVQIATGSLRWKDTLTLSPDAGSLPFGSVPGEVSREGGVATSWMGTLIRYQGTQGALRPPPTGAHHKKGRPRGSARTRDRRGRAG